MQAVYGFGYIALKKRGGSLDSSVQYLWDSNHGVKTTRGRFDLYLDQVGGLQYGALCGKDLPVIEVSP